MENAESEWYMALIVGYTYGYWCVESENVKIVWLDQLLNNSIFQPIIIKDYNYPFQKLY